MTWAVFISGFGSNLGALLNHRDEVKVSLVVSNKAGAYGLERAKQAGVETKVISSNVDWQELHQELIRRDVNAIFLAGFMKVIPEAFVAQWKGKIFNVHPSLLPKYKGLKSIERAYKDKSDIGVTVHEVIPEVDSGKICRQEIAVRADEVDNYTLEECEQKVHELEHELVTQWVLQWQKSMTS